MSNRSLKKTYSEVGKEFLQSFARRKSRAFSRSQQKLMDERYPQFRISDDAANFKELIKGYSQIYFEIGFGAGEHLVHLAENNPDTLIIGAEVYLNGVASAFQVAQEKALNNIIFYDEDSRILINNMPDSIIDKIYILFADPWPKKRHHKRRIINAEIFPMLHRILKSNGSIRIATDHADYYEWIVEACKEQKLFTVDKIEQPEDHLVTRFQQKAIDEGRESRFIELVKK